MHVHSPSFTTVHVLVSGNEISLQCECHADYMDILCIGNALMCGLDRNAVTSAKPHHRHRL